MKEIILLIIFVPAFLFAQPKEEVRAVWLTTAFGLDWPKSHDKEIQKEEIINILDELKDANFNTVMLQVRARGDLIYPSKLEPWAKSLTGELGKNPGYDPLKFIIAEAHKRGIEIHAWWNVYKVYGKGMPAETWPENPVLKYPDFCSEYRDEWWMDPGIPAVRKYLLNVIMEMVRNYDIDGINLDYLRYPNSDFDDYGTYRKYGNNENRSDWRRDNITKFVESLYDSLQEVKPYVKLGCAPVGIYKNTDQISGWEAYYDTFQDPVKWIKDKKLDYISPQVYWKINSHPHYNLVIKDWGKIIDKRHLYPGIAVFQLSSNYANWKADEILAQIDTLRKLDIKGEVFFRTNDLINNEKNILTLIKHNKFRYPADIPPMPWKDNAKPLPPTGLTLLKSPDREVELYWQNLPQKINRDTACYINIYASNKYPVDISDPKNILKLRVPACQNNVTLDLNSFPSDKYYLVITALDRNNNESVPSNTTTFTIQPFISPVVIAKGQRE